MARPAGSFARRRARPSSRPQCTSVSRGRTRRAHAAPPRESTCAAATRWRPWRSATPSASPRRHTDSMDAGRRRIADYIRSAGLQTLAGREPDIERSVRDLLEAMAERIDVGNTDSLYTYPVPMLTDDGTCSVVDQMAPVPYDLTPKIGRAHV